MHRNFVKKSGRVHQARARQRKLVMVLRILKTLADNTTSSEDALLVHAIVKSFTHPKEVVLRSSDYIEGRKPISPLGFIETNKLNILAEVDIFPRILASSSTSLPRASELDWRGTEAELSCSRVPCHDMSHPRRLRVLLRSTYEKCHVACTGAPTLGVCCPDDEDLKTCALIGYFINFSM